MTRKTDYDILLIAAYFEAARAHLDRLATVLRRRPEVTDVCAAQRHYCDPQRHYNRRCLTPARNRKMYQQIRSFYEVTVSAPAVRVKAW